MKNRNTVIVLTLALLCSLILSCKNEPKIKVEDEILNTSKKFLNSQYEFLVSKTDQPGWKSLMENKESDTLLPQIRKFKNDLKQINFNYSAYVSFLKLDSIHIVGNEAYLLATDKIKLTTNDKDPTDTSKFIITEGSFSYEIKFRKAKDQWLITGFKTLSGDRFHSNVQDVQKTISREFSNKSNIDVKLDADAPAYIYLPDIARDYAYVNYLNGEPAYCDFSSGGGDCTNFLSLCLQAGGWRQNGNWRTQTKTQCPGCRNWYPQCLIEDCYTCSWTVAQKFHDYVITSGRVQNGIFRDEQLEIGDIMQFGPSADKIVHSAIVTNKTTTGGVIKVYVTYRNSSSAGKPFKDRLSSEIGGPHYGFKVKPNAQ